MHRLGRWRTAALLGALIVASVVGPWSAVGAVAESMPGHYLDIDITNQVLSDVVNGEVAWSAHISTGNEEWFWSGDGWSLAHTPRGWFEIYWRDPGWAEGDLGWLYNALYFTGPFAIHGSNSVPYYPASHGCVRVSIEDAEWLFTRIDDGTPVIVHD